MKNNVIYYPFELHTHTIHSDGNFTPETLIKAVSFQGIKGIAITDHNAVSGQMPTIAEGKKNGIIVIPGIEWTTFYGHITVLGATDIVDWRSVNPDTIKEKALQVRNNNGAIGIAHPFRIGYPVCTGGSDDWKLDGKDYENFTHYEIWSYLSPAKDDTNKLSEIRYDKIISSGVRMSAVYGRDWHNPKDENAFAVTYLGIKDDLNYKNAINAVIEGRTYVSTGVEMSVSLKNANGEYGLGEEIDGGSYNLNLTLSLADKKYSDKYGVEISGIELVGNGIDNPIKIDATQINDYDISLKSGYIRIRAYGKIEGEYGLLLTSSPIYIR